MIETIYKSESTTIVLQPPMRRVIWLNSDKHWLSFPYVLLATKTFPNRPIGVYPIKLYVLFSFGNIKGENSALFKATLCNVMLNEEVCLGDDNELHHPDDVIHYFWNSQFSTNHESFLNRKFWKKWIRGSLVSPTYWKCLPKIDAQFPTYGKFCKFLGITNDK